MNLKQTTQKNVKWSFIESISLKLVSFVLSIILARLLMPSDFGILAIVNVFYLMTSIFIDGGLKDAVIQKQNADEKDFSTMFWLNLGMASLLYVILFVAAPSIQQFYQIENLSFYIRIQSVTLIIESFGLIQIVKANRELNLKKITTSRIPASIISFLIGIYLAYQGFGIMALIIQQLVSVSLYNFLLIYTIRYKPKWIFSTSSVKSLYGFGVKVFVFSYISRMYVQSVNLLYAYFFNTRELGLFSKSKSLQGVPIEIIDSTFTKALYPTFVKVQHQNRMLRKIFMFNITRLFYVMVIINTFLYFNSHEIIAFLLGEKWLEMKTFLQIAAIGSLFAPINSQIINIFKAKGMPGVLLKYELFWKIAAVLIIIVMASISFSFSAILWVIVGLNSFMGLLYIFLTSKQLEFSFFKLAKQMALMLVFFVASGLLCKIVINMVFAEVPDVVKIIIYTTLYFIFVLIYGLKFKDFNVFNLIRLR
ncbi:MAG: lipopolysaccharide biosynthesis protein [Flavobacterium sp.]